MNADARKTVNMIRGDGAEQHRVCYGERECRKEMENKAREREKNEFSSAEAAAAAAAVN